jgi:hypothetical protein
MDMIHACLPRPRSGPVPVDRVGKVDVAVMKHKDETHLG